MGKLSCYQEWFLIRNFINLFGSLRFDNDVQITTRSLGRRQKGLKKLKSTKAIKQKEAGSCIVENNVLNLV